MLKADKITFRYTDEGRPAVDGLSLGVRRGEYVAVLGANGCGKSTLAKHFNAILLPAAGTVTVEGISTADEERLFEIRQKVGMVFQNPDNQIVATVVEEDVAFALENLGVPPVEMRARVDEAMRMAGVYNYREKAPHKLSGGQKQRVAIAGVVAMRPDCLVLDEATAMLDPIGREKVMRTVHRLNREFGITVVQITHYMEEAATADRVIVMSEGKIALEGTPKEVFRQVDRLRALRLDVPQAAELCHALTAAGCPMPDDVIDIEGCAAALYRLLTGREAPGAAESEDAPYRAEGAWNREDAPHRAEGAWNKENAPQSAASARTGENDQSARNAQGAENASGARNAQGAENASGANGAQKAKEVAACPQR